MQPAWPRYRLTKTDEIDFFVTETPPRYWVLWEPGMQLRALLGGPSLFRAGMNMRRKNVIMRRETCDYNNLLCARLATNLFAGWKVCSITSITRRDPWLSNEVSTVIAQCVGMTQFIAWLCPGWLPWATSSAFLVTGRSNYQPLPSTLHPPPAQPLQYTNLTILWINHRLWTRWLLNLRQTEAPMC